MSYFSGIKKGDRIWSFATRDFEEVKDKYINWFSTDKGNMFDLDGCLLDNNGTKITNQQIAFWDKVEFKVPQMPKIVLKEDYSRVLSVDIVTSQINKKALKQIKRFARLLALRDQECEDSKGYEFKKGGDNYLIYFNGDKEKWCYSGYTNDNYFGVYTKTTKDAQKIIDILNSGRFDLDK